MKSLGYIPSCKWQQNVEGMIFEAIRFDPIYTDDFTNQIRYGRYVYHLSPTYNLGSIKKNGFVPKSENTKYMYKERIFL